MRAFLDRDLITNFHRNGDTEVGDKPPGVGLERLRFDGTQIVDLADLSLFHVEHLGGCQFILHAISVPGSQPISMTYDQRRHLIYDGNMIRLKTSQEINDDNVEAIKQDASARLFRNLQKTTGTLEERELQSLMLICALIIYARQTPPKLAALFDKLIPHILDLFPPERVEALLIQSMQDLKNSVEQYWADVDEVNTL